MYKDQLQGKKQEKENKNTQCLMRSLKKKFQIPKEPENQNVQ